VGRRGTAEWKPVTGPAEINRFHGFIPDPRKRAEKDDFRAKWPNEEKIKVFG
jgi:hypothetical protein